MLSDGRCGAHSLTDDDQEPPANGPSRDSLRLEHGELCRLLLAEQALITKIFDGNQLASPRWEILLDLYLAALEGRALYQSALVSQLSPAASHRLAATLERQDLVERGHDEADHRRTLVSLRPRAMTAMDHLLDDLHRRGASFRSTGQ